VRRQRSGSGTTGHEKEYEKEIIKALWGKELEIELFACEGSSNICGELFIPNHCGERKDIQWLKVEEQQQCESSVN
jgi:hypothetical protein